MCTISLIMKIKYELKIQLFFLTRTQHEFESSLVTKNTIIEELKWKEGNEEREKPQKRVQMQAML